MLTINPGEKQRERDGLRAREGRKKKKKKEQKHKWSGEKWTAKTRQA